LGNGTQAYAKAYNIDLSQKGKKGVAKASASRLLTYDSILDYINKMLDLEGVNDESADEVNLKSEVNLTSVLKELKGLSTEELMKRC
jgi:hypothetical protein